MNGNPWVKLPAKPPFVLPDDEEVIDGFNAKRRSTHKHYLKADIIPEAFVGARDAPVVLLSNNPGYGKKAHHKRKARFRSRMRKNLRHAKLKYPFVHLDPKFPIMNKWWDRRLKSLNHIFPRETVARSLLNVPYFPYPSSRFGHSKIKVPSQEYSFDLVHEAMTRGAVIIFMRKKERWVKEIPKLKKYKLAFSVKNRQNPTLNPGNLPKGAFEKIVLAIATTEAKRQQSD